MKNLFNGLFSRQGKFFPFIIAVFALVVLLFVYSQTTRWYHASLITEKKAQVEAILAPNGDNINNALQRRISLIAGLNAFIQSYLVSNNSFTAEEFSHFSQSLYGTFSGIRKIAVAPHGIVSLEYPPSLSDSYIGKDLVRLANPITNDAVTRSILTKKISFSGPLKMEKASMIVTAHQAVFDEDDLWGLITFDFDLIQIISETNISFAQSDLIWGLLDDQGQIFLGDPSISAKDPVEYRIGLPEGSWYLQAAPRDGWEKSIAAEYQVFTTINLVIIGLLTILVYVVSSQQTRLSRMIQLRTAALQSELDLREAAEALLKSNEEKFHSVFTQMSDMAILFQLVPGNIPGNILEVNDAACRLLGFSRDEFLNLNLMDLELSDKRVRLFQRANAALRPENGFFETEIIMRNGEILPVEIRYRQFPMQDTEVGLIIARDISERKTAEKNLQRANRALRVLIEFNESLVRAESETELMEVLCSILVNTGQYDVAWAGFIDADTGHMATRFIERSNDRLHLAIPEDSVLESLPLITDHSISLPLVIENRVVGGLGIVLTEDSKLSEEEVYLFQKLADDFSYGMMTLRLRSEAREKTEQLRASEALYHGLARNVPNGVVILFDRNLNHILADGLGLEDFNLNPEAVIGKPASSLFPPEVSTAINTQYEQAIAGNPNSREYRIQERSYEMHCSPIKNDQGSVVMGLNLIQNITEHKKLQQTIKHQQKEQQRILDSIPAMVFFKTADKKIIWVNQTFQTFTGLPAKAVLNKFDSEIHNPALSSYIIEGDEELLATLKPQFNMIQEVSFNGGQRWLKTDKIPIFYSDGSLEGLLGFSFDITDLKLAEQEILQLNLELEGRVARRTAELEEKNRELESFTFSVSHDLKAPLRGISGYSQLLMEDYASRLDQEGLGFLKKILNSVQHMDQLISDLLAYSRMERRSIVKRRIDIRETIQSILLEFQDEIQSRNIQVEEKYAFSVIDSDPDALSLVMRNLIGNAVKFTRNQSKPRIQITGSNCAESWQIFVVDNGIGFDMVYQEKIFEIFQRLQNSETYPGTGVGLAIVRKGLNRLGGTVSVESERGKGAAFIIELPKGRDGSH